MPTIRAKSVCVFRQGEQLLLAEGFDPGKNEHYLMPVGGGIDFGETAANAARREVLEEIGAEIQDIELLGVLENLFVFDGTPGHEIVFIHEARLVDPRLYAAAELEGVETSGHRFKVRWISLQRIREQRLNLYPQGLLDLL
ncbi:NUDIX domain-containing protein [Pseudomonas chlororaphis]|uniref:NUDIX hydrolase n=1 Tax=Pseudomonas chlororaphis TaxID=587753 RepID=UPI001E412235|nr:NUDIX domain-containing protein [Pseudomonas chlororaphis]MCB2250885.1 NUDIX domain-containing protein [Pseudomonas chlororaphis]